MTARDNYLAHLTARTQRLLAVQDRAEREGNQEALQSAQEVLGRIEAAIVSMAAVDDEYGRCQS